MNEGRTTAIFGIIAAVAVGLAWWSKPEVAVSTKEVLDDIVGGELFSSFDDPENAASMQIVKYNEMLAQRDKFEVARDPDTKLWTLPSNDGYPADAAEQVKDATTPLIGLRVLDVVSALASDHELYGVVSPDGEITAATSGVGMLVTFKDDVDQVLASLVVGKQVEQADGQYYARIPTEDAVYKVEIDTSVFKTDFRDWIEGELLGVRSMDIDRVAVRDYSLEQTLTQVMLQRNFDAEVSFDADANKWSLDSMQSYEGGQATPMELAEGEELNSDFLSALRTAVQQLEIIDVQRKPKGLAADLKADDSLLKNQESVASLQRQGFFAATGPNGTEIFAAGGETIIGTESGVDYLLRFGEVRASLSSAEGDDSEDGGLSRYLLVTAKLNDGKFPPADIQPVPNTVEEMLALEKGEAGETEGLSLPELDPGDIPTSDSDSGDSAEGSDSGNEERPPSPKSNVNSSASDAGDDAAVSAEEASAEEATEENSTEDSPAEDSPAVEETQEELNERLEALKEKIAKENQRRIDERNEKIDEARKKVLELNARFSDWFYVVGDSVYKKLKVSREDLIKKAAEPAAVDAAAPNFTEGLLDNLP